MANLTNFEDIKNGSQEMGEICKPCIKVKIELCARIHDDCDVVGHTFIAIDDVKADGTQSGSKIIKGFYPAKSGDTRSIFWENNFEIETMQAPGQVLDDSDSYGREKFAMRQWIIGFDQARAAIEFIEAREKNPGQYSLWTRQCNNFALDVLGRAGINTQEFRPKHGPVRPSYTFQVLSGRQIPAAQWPPINCVSKEYVAEPAVSKFSDLFQDTIGLIGN